MAWCADDETHTHSSHWHGHRNLFDSIWWMSQADVERKMFCQYYSGVSATRNHTLKYINDTLVVINYYRFIDRCENAQIFLSFQMKRKCSTKGIESRSSFMVGADWSKWPFIIMIDWFYASMFVTISFTWPWQRQLLSVWSMFQAFTD